MNLARSRKIKVFISSTFMDMHNERDYLNTYIFPRIHEYCKERFIEFYPIDLRWGITEQELIFESLNFSLARAQEENPSLAVMILLLLLSLFPPSLWVPHWPAPRALAGPAAPQPFRFFPLRSCFAMKRLAGEWRS